MSNVNEEGQWLSHGRNCQLQVLIVAPLFEENNRCRRLIVAIMRALEQQGIGSTLPDLPGTGESLTSVKDVLLSDWRNAVDTASAKISPTLIMSFRGGALIDGAKTAKGWWRCAPETGERVVRDLRRTRLNGGMDEPALYAGNSISDDLLTALECATPAGVSPLRTVRLESDPADADAKFLGVPLWRRTEPGHDAALAAALASDICDWTKSCAVS